MGGVHITCFMLSLSFSGVPPSKKSESNEVKKGADFKMYRSGMETND